MPSSVRKRNCWTNKSRLEQILICILILALMLIIVLLVLILHPSHTEPPKICDSPMCLQEAAKILNKIDPTVDPCQDFYDFACGKFLKSSHGDPKFNLFNRVKEKQKHQLLELCSEDIKNEDHKMVKVAKTLFRKCMNESEIEKDNLRTIKDVLKAVGGWPILEGRYWNEKQFDWINATYKLRELGYPYQILFDINVDVDREKWDKYILTVSPSITDYDETRQSLSESMEVERMSEIAIIFGSPSFRDEIEMEMNKTYQFWKKLKQPSFAYANSKSTTIGVFQTYGVNFDWFEFLNQIVGPKVNISKDNYAFFQSYEYYRQYFDVILRTPKRVLANYMMWKVVEKQIPYLTRSLRNIEGEKKEETRAEFCLRTLQEKFSPNPIAILRDRKYLSNKQRNYQRKLMVDMKTEFIKKLERAHWMSKEEKNVVVRRAKEIKIRVGEHENYFDNTILNDLDVDMVKPRSESFLALLAQATRNHQTSRYKLLEELAVEDPINDNVGLPYYYEKTNSIVVPTIAVDGFFWADECIPNYLNYAESAGFAFAGFLGAISRKGFEGENYNFSGFSNETTKIITDIVECLLNQTENDTLDDNQVQVQFMILQMFGEEISRAAYQDWEKHNEKEPRLIGLDYSPLQLFWIASTDCYIVEKDSKSISRDPQTPKCINQRSRMNNPDFAKDFNCALGTKMNPVNKCKLL